jgi:quercetin dioxygenase-like cupin family protein
MFEKCSKEGYKRALDGIEQKTLVHGDNTLMVEFLLQKNAVLPLHSHPHEQTGYLIKGRIRLTVGADVHEVMPGDSWCVPGSVLHGAEIIEESVAVEVFSPVRKDYLPLKEKICYACVSTSGYLE